MAAWFLLPAAMAAVSGYSKYKQAQNQPVAPARRHTAFRQKAQTGYLKRYMADLRGRSADRARTELAMRPALRAIGAQQAKGQRQLAYQAAQQGLTGSGIEAQKQLTLQQGTTQAVAGLGEKVLSQQLAQAQQLQAQKEGQRMKLAGEIGRQESAVAEANRRAQFQATQANIAEQQGLEFREAQKAANVANVGTQAWTDVGLSLAGGLQQQYAPMTTAQKEKQQAELDYRYGNAEGGVVPGFQGSGVVPSPISQFLEAEQEPTVNTLVDFASSPQYAPGYEKALIDFQTKRNKEHEIQHKDKIKQYDLYTSKIDQIADIKKKVKEEGDPDATLLPVTRSQRNKIKKLKKETKVEVLNPGEFKPYELDEGDSTSVASTYLSQFRNINKLVKGHVKKEQAKIDTRVDDLMDDIYEMEYRFDQGIGAGFDTENLLKLLRHPDIKASSNEKTITNEIRTVLDNIQEKREKITGVTEKASNQRIEVKRGIIQNVFSMGDFLKTVTAIKDDPDTPDVNEQGYDVQDNMESVLDEIQMMIKYGEHGGGIPDMSYEDIVSRVREIVDTMSIPLSQLQVISDDARETMLRWGGKQDVATGNWQIEGGDAKFKRKMVEELTKDLHKTAMWKDSVGDDDKKTEGTLQENWWE